MEVIKRKEATKIQKLFECSLLKKYVFLHQLNTYFENKFKQFYVVKQPNFI